MKTNTEFPHFHIITVCKDDDIGLAATCNSIDQQTYEWWSHWIQDGQSVPNFLLAESYFSHPRRTFVSSADAGIYDAMNKASDWLRGELIMYLNAGDTLSAQDVLERVRQSYVSDRWRWAVGHLTVAKPNGDSFLWVPTRLTPRHLALGLGGGCPHPATIFSRDLLESVLPYDTNLPIAADQALCARALDQAEPEYLPFPIANFAPGGLSSTVSALRHERELHKLRRVLGRSLLGNPAIDRAMIVPLAICRQLLKLLPRRRLKRVGLGKRAR